MKPNFESHFRFRQTEQHKANAIFLFAVLCLIFFSAARANADSLDNWQVQQLGTDILTGVTYGNGTYVIVGYPKGKIWTSPDASAWTDRTFDTSTSSYCVTFANGVFVAGGIYPFASSYYDGIQSSTDGIKWATTGISYYGIPYGITYTNNKFFAVGQSAIVKFSSDGYDWGNSNDNTSGAPAIYGIAYGNGMYVVAIQYIPSAQSNIWANSIPPQSGLPQPVCTSSPCPSGYFRKTGTTSDMHGVAYGNSTFVAVGTGGSIITSPDGITWTSRTSGTANSLYAITFANGVFATAGDGGTILTSPDGITWTARASNTTNLLRGIAFANNRFIAVGVSGTVTISGSAPSNSGNVGNISTRSVVGAGDNVMIAGIIIQGGSRKIIIRAVGPSLSAFGVSDALADPILELHDSSNVIATNNDWHTTQTGGIITADQSTDIQNSGFAPGSPKESAIIATLSPGSYTAIVKGANGVTGVGLVEVFTLP